MEQTRGCYCYGWTPVQICLNILLNKRRLKYVTISWDCDILCWNQILEKNIGMSSIPQ
jgi:hypothetical protein